jgi:predicted HicB family RNase H-like nuclease
MSKDLKYYMGLPYRIEVVPIPQSLGGGFSATLPEIGEYAITGDGESAEAAIRNLEEAKRSRFEDYLAQGINIPEPEGQEEDVSGRFVLRIPKALHRRLVREAKKNQTSLNQYVTYLLSNNFEEEKHQRQLKEVIGHLEGIRDGMWNMGMSHRLYQIESSSIEDRLGHKNAKVIQFRQPKAA